MAETCNLSTLNLLQTMEKFEEGQELTVEPYFEDIPLGEFLRAYTPFDSKRKLQKLVDRGVVEVNGITRPLNFMLQSGDVVSIGEGSSKRERDYPDPEVLSSDQQLIILSTYPGQKIGTRPQGNALSEMDLGEEMIRSLPVGIDRTAYPIYPVPEGVSGIVCLTMSRESQNEFQQQFGTGQLRLSGDAIVDGVVNSTKKIEQPVGPSEHDRSKQEIREEGPAAITVIEPVKEFRKFSLVRVQPKTAVWDQVRVHLNFLHHPLSVDPRYGYREELNLSEFKQDYRDKPFQEERPLIERISLHWSQLERDDGEDIQVSKPEDMEISIKQLTNHGS